MCQPDAIDHPSSPADLFRILRLLVSLERVMEEGEVGGGCLLGWLGVPRLLSLRQGREIDALRTALVQALEPLREADCRRVDPPVVQAMRRVLSRCARPASIIYSPRLSIALLDALGKVADETTLGCVIGLAESPITRDRHHEQVCAAACRARDAIRLRLGREAASGTLLRPADAPADTAGTLLRPAEGRAEGDPQTLLRPVNSEEK